MPRTIEALEEERRKIVGFISSGEKLPICLELVDRELHKARKQQSIAGGEVEGERLSEQQTSTGYTFVPLKKRKRSTDDEDERHPIKPSVDIDLDKTLEDDNEKMQALRCLPVTQWRLGKRITKEKEIKRIKQPVRWTPELKQKFKEAVKHLGGAQVATAEMIMEHMQIEDLIRAQVDSHLQKFREKIEKAARNSR